MSDKFDKFHRYQVDGPNYPNGGKLVSELTEEEAKRELCVSIEVLESLDTTSINLRNTIKKWRKG